MRAWIWMKCCVSTDVGTWTNWLTFEPDPDYSPDAGTGLLSLLSYKRCYAEFYVGKSRRIRIGPLTAAARRGFIHWSSQPSKHLCRRYMRSTKCFSSYLLTRSIDCMPIYRRFLQGHSYIPSQPQGISSIDRYQIILCGNRGTYVTNLPTVVTFAIWFTFARCCYAIVICLTL